MDGAFSDTDDATETRTETRVSDHGDADASSAEDDELIDEPIGALVDVAVEAVRPYRMQNRREMWLEPLREPRPIEQVHETFFGEPWNSNYGHRLDPAMVVPVGIVDRPRQWAQDPLAFDLSAANIGIIGHQGSGRTTTVMAFLVSLALRYPPQYVQFIGIGFGGPGLQALADLPHTAGVFGGDDPEGVNRAIAEVVHLFTKREQSFSECGIADVREWRLRRFGLSEGPVPDDGFGEVWLVVDNWARLYSDFERVHELLKTIIANCGSYGIHIIWTHAARVGGGLQKTITDNTKLLLELRLADQSLTEVDRKAAANIPDDIPGRGLSPDGFHMLYAFPGIEATDGQGLQAGVLVNKIRAVAGSDKPAIVRKLPHQVTFDEVWSFPPTTVDHKHSIRIGLSETDLGPVRIDFSRFAHFITVGSAESGRSNFIRVVAQGIMRQYTPDEAVIYMIDITQNQLGVIDEESGYLGKYCFLQEHVMQAVMGIVKELKTRQPEGEVDQRTLMASAGRFTGKRIFVLIDDFNALSAGGVHVGDLAEFVELARFVGIHIVVAGQTTDFMRWSGRSELMMKLLSVQTPGVVMDGSKHDGPMVGDVVAERQRPGRGIHVQRGQNPAAMLFAWREPPAMPEQ